MEFLIAIGIFVAACAVFYFSVIRKERKLSEKPHQDDGFEPEWPDGKPNESEPDV